MTLKVTVCLTLQHLLTTPAHRTAKSPSSTTLSNFDVEEDPATMQKPPGLSSNHQTATKKQQATS
jgi:hypothetical protein